MKNIKKIIRESKITPGQLKLWKKINKLRNDYGICERCFRRTIQILEEEKLA